MAIAAPAALTVLSADGNSAAYEATGFPIVIMASGTFGSGTLIMQISPDEGTTWFATGQTLSAIGIMIYTPPEGAQFRLNLAGSTTPTIASWVGAQKLC
jgi:hypothetical protein